MINYDAIITSKYVKADLGFNEVLTTDLVVDALNLAGNSKVRRYLKDQIALLANTFCFLSCCDDNHSYIDLPKGSRYYANEFKIPNCLMGDLINVGKIYFSQESKAFKLPCCVKPKVKFDENKVLTPTEFELGLREYCDLAKKDWNLSNIDKVDYSLFELSMVEVKAEDDLRKVLLGGNLVNDKVIHLLGLRTYSINFDPNEMRTVDIFDMHDAERLLFV